MAGVVPGAHGDRLLTPGQGSRRRDAGGWCDALVHRLAAAVDEHAWDGAWYRRAFFDDGTPLGSQQNAECSIDAIAQSWSVIAGVGNRDRARQALRSSEDKLLETDSALMRLLWPPFDKAEPDPGYIRAYPSGIRENGGQYTHGVLWTVYALTLLGQGDRAVALMALLNPIHHGSTRERLSATGSSLMWWPPTSTMRRPRRPRRMDLVHRRCIVDVPRDGRAHPGREA